MAQAFQPAFTGQAGKPTPRLNPARRGFLLQINIIIEVDGYNKYIIMQLMAFEYDPEKSRSNKEKHGIDFEEAKLLWLDNRQVELPSLEPREERYLVIGQLDGKIWTAIVTYRNGDIRIISVRRARPKEAEIYES